jgi:hypothetical protein
LWYFNVKYHVRGEHIMTKIILKPLDYCNIWINKCKILILLLRFHFFFSLIGVRPDSDDCKWWETLTNLSVSKYRRQYERQVALSLRKTSYNIKCIRRVKFQKFKNLENSEPKIKQPRKIYHHLQSFGAIKHLHQEK